MQAALRSRDIGAFFAVGVLFDYYDEVQNDDNVSFLEALASRDRLRAMPSDSRRSTLASNTLRDVVLELQRDGDRGTALPFYSEPRVAAMPARLASGPLARL
jgi:hypothetical protein